MTLASWAASAARSAGGSLGFHPGITVLGVTLWGVMAMAGLAAATRAAISRAARSGRRGDTHREYAETPFVEWRVIRRDTPCGGATSRHSTNSPSADVERGERPGDDLGVVAERGVPARLPTMRTLPGLHTEGHAAAIGDARAVALLRVRMA